MSDQETIFVPYGTLAISIPMLTDEGRTFGAELVWLRPANGINRPWVGYSDWLDAKIMQSPDPSSFERYFSLRDDEDNDNYNG